MKLFSRIVKSEDVEYLPNPFTYVPPTPWTVRKLIQELTAACERHPDVADYTVFAADDCTSACDTEVSSIGVDSAKTRLTVGG